MTQDNLRELVSAECFRMVKLGSTKAIAQELASRGMRGVKGDCKQCPIARGIADTLLISTQHISVQNEGVLTDSDLFKSELLCTFQEGFRMLCHFIEEFDAGHFPFLESEPATN